MIPSTRSQAIALGAPRYFTGKPCKHGHVDNRTRLGICCSCAIKFKSTLEYKKQASVYNAGPISITQRKAYKLTPVYKAKQRLRWKTDFNFRLDRFMGIGLNKAIKNKGGKHWESFVPYDLNQLKIHLETQFTEGMTWDNYGRGGWVIDHIRPRCSFQYTSFEDTQFKECWDLKNLRPLWEVDNLAKISQDKQFSLRKTSWLSMHN